MASEKKQIIIPREDSVFWMDKNGTWHNEHGRFEHPKIIHHFNRSIQKDDQGYFLGQTMDGDGVEEKVYFPCEDTAVFVVDLIVKDSGDTIDLVLNIGEKRCLKPGHLFIRDDSLFAQTRDHLIKFNQQSLVKLSSLMDETDQGLTLTLGSQVYILPEK